MLTLQEKVADKTGAIPLCIASEPSHTDTVQALRDADAAKDKANEQVQLHFALPQNRAMLKLSKHF